MWSFFRERRRQNDPPGIHPGSFQFHVAPDIKASMHPEGLVLMHLGKGTVFASNRAGAMIWEGAVGHWTLDRVAERIGAEFDIPRQTARQDALRFVEELAAEGLLLPDTR